MRQHPLTEPNPQHYRGHAKAWYASGLVVFFALVALVRPFVAPYLSSAASESTVSWVIDGDTVVLEDGRHVRYIGIDTPEMDALDERLLARAEEALAMNIKLVKGKLVRLEFDVEKRDKYGRTLAHVWAGEGFDTLVSGQLVKAGLARAVVYGRSRRYAERLAALEKEARDAGLGIWSADDSRTEHTGP